MGRIVVGVDGSPNSRAALAWAVEEAGQRNATVEVVMTWQEPYIGGGMVPPVPLDLEMLEKSHREELDSIVNAVDTAGLSGSVERTLVRGPAARELVERSKDAELLVVGSRGHGGFMGVLLGSVSFHVASHASCPVVIVPASTTE